MESEGTGRMALGRHFRARASAVVAAWRAAVAADPSLKTGASLPRAQLEDHLPGWLDAFAGVLEQPAGAASTRVDVAEKADARAHGLQRWQQGYDLHEVTREWGCMHRCLVAEMEHAASIHPGLPAADLAEARLKLADRISDATSASAEQYFRLERVEASGSVRDLERALGDVRALELARAELWQQAAHDLRGNLGVVSNVATGLSFSELPAERRQDFLGRLRNNVEALRLLLDDVTSLARLQAGQELRSVAPFDAAQLLRRLCDDVRPMAESRRLTLEASGPETLRVEGDAVKVRRVVQNLLLNALKYTRVGGVVVTWGDSDVRDEARWRLTIADTGPGFHSGPGSPLANALSQATVQGHPETGGTSGGVDAEVATSDAGDVMPVPGEGIGLSIVKRLCELLNASVELESAPDQGTTFRILLPRSYAAPPAA